MAKHVGFIFFLERHAFIRVCKSWKHAGSSMRIYRHSKLILKSYIYHTNTNKNVRRIIQGRWWLIAIVNSLYHLFKLLIFTIVYVRVRLWKDKQVHKRLVFRVADNTLIQTSNVNRHSLLILLYIVFI